MTPGSCASWGTSEKADRPRAGVRAAHLRVHGDQPDRRGIHALPRPRSGARARRPATALGDARRAAVLPPAAPELERLGGPRQPHLRGMVRRYAALRARPDVRLLP